MGDVARMEEKGNPSQFVAEIKRGIDHLKYLAKDFKIILELIHEIKVLKSIDHKQRAQDKVHVRSFSLRFSQPEQQNKLSHGA
jgi:hypothetical protein